MKDFILKNQLTTLGEHVVYYKKFKNKYKFMCSECGSTWYGTYQDLKKIRNTSMCPKCFYTIRQTSTVEHFYNKALYDERTKKGYQYFFTVKNAKVTNLKITEMFKVVDNKAYIKGFHRVNVWWTSKHFSPDYQWQDKKDIPKKYDWRKTSRGWEDYFDYWVYHNGKIRHHKPRTQTYKEYVEKLFNFELHAYKKILKSNQEYLIKNNILNKEMIVFMLQYNLNNVDLLYKYAKYCNNYYFSKKGFYNDMLNEHAFEYCAKSLIPPANYIDYRESCEAIGIKDKYPKDFLEKDAEVQMILNNQNDEEKAKRFDKQLKKIKLPKAIFSANSKNYYINAYHSTSELKNDANTFSNCIYNNYLEDYAKRDTDLYRCIDENGKLIACIEIQDNEIQQIMGNKNSRPRLYKQIRSALVEMVGA